MASWFKDIDLSRDSNWWYDQLWFNYECWNNHSDIVNRVKGLYPSISAGRRLHKVGTVERAFTDIKNFKDIIDDGTIYLLNQEQIDEEYQAAAKSWEDAVQVYFNSDQIEWKQPRDKVEGDDDGDQVMEETKRKKVKFGPWILYTKENWEKQLHKFRIYKRKQSLSEVSAPSSNEGGTNQPKPKQKPKDQQQKDNHNHNKHSDSHLSEEEEDKATDNRPPSKSKKRKSRHRERRRRRDRSSDEDKSKSRSRSREREDSRPKRDKSKSHSKSKSKSKKKSTKSNYLLTSSEDEEDYKEV